MVPLNEISQWLQVEDPEEYKIIANVSWKQYEALLAELGDSPAYRVNDLELLSECVLNPSPLAAAKAFRQGLRDRLTNTTIINEQLTLDSEQ